MRRVWSIDGNYKVVEVVTLTLEQPTDSVEGSDRFSRVFR